MNRLIFRILKYLSEFEFRDICLKFFNDDVYRFLWLSTCFNQYVVQQKLVSFHSRHLVYFNEIRTLIFPQYTRCFSVSIFLSLTIFIRFASNLFDQRRNSRKQRPVRDQDQMNFYICWRLSFFCCLLGGVFVVLLCGLAFAVLIAIFEFCYNTRRSMPAERVNVWLLSYCEYIADLDRWIGIIHGF